MFSTDPGVAMSVHERSLNAEGCEEGWTFSRSAEL